MKIEFLKEKFIFTYCKKRGWDPDKLTQNQMLLIVSDDNYKKIDTKKAQVS